MATRTRGVPFRTRQIENDTCIRFCVREQFHVIQSIKRNNRGEVIETSFGKKFPCDHKECAAYRDGIIYELNLTTGQSKPVKKGRGTVICLDAERKKFRRNLPMVIANPNPVWNS